MLSVGAVAYAITHLVSYHAPPPPPARAITARNLRQVKGLPALPAPAEVEPATPADLRALGLI